MQYYEVAPTRIVRTSVQFFTYHSHTMLQPGAIVRIPVGKTQAYGIVLRRVEQPKFDTREITGEVTSRPLPQALLQTALWMSEYYATPLATVLSGILPRGIDKQRRARSQAPTRPAIREQKTLQPTSEQTQAIQTIQTSTSTTHLLHGVTGSGKTLVYKTLATDTLQQGKSAIILVPEIALTSQVVDEFRQAFGERVILAHSQQTEAERHTIWQQVLESSSPYVVIGPRSALFLPLQKIGLIVVDEMHEPSYKQEQAPRYSALRVATILASHHQAKAVFGSATPPVAEYYAAKQSGAPIITLSHRADAAAMKPAIHIVDMTKRQNFTSHRFFSNTLLSSIDHALTNNQQVLLFHNRRGSAAITLCHSCGWTAVDPETGIPLTLHADSHTLVSHISRFTMSVPTVCPVCNETEIIHKGIGTKLIESELRRLYPNKNIVRFDGDGAKEHSVDARYKELYDGSIDVIIGTQVIAKGIDLPHLTAVGIIQADAGLSLPDFTSRERVFQLIAQAVGRVGRNAQHTTIVVQSYQPQDPAIRYGVTQKYDAFYTEEIATRQHYTFPPYSYLLKFVCSYKTERAAIQNAKKFSAHLRNVIGSNGELLGPTPAFYEKQAGSYRWQITVRSPQRARLLQLIHALPPGPHWQYEIDPVGLLS